MNEVSTIEPKTQPEVIQGPRIVNFKVKLKTRKARKLKNIQARHMRKLAA